MARLTMSNGVVVNVADEKAERLLTTQSVRFSKGTKAAKESVVETDAGTKKTTAAKK